MKKTFFAVLLGLVSLSFAGGPEGKISAGLPDSYQLASVADWYTTKNAAGSSVVVATTYSGLKLKGIRNNSGTLQKILFITNIGDTCLYALNAYETSGKLPPIRKIISGAVADSTLYFFQAN